MEAARAREDADDYDRAAGQGVGVLSRSESAAEIIATPVAEARAVLARF